MIFNSISFMGELETGPTCSGMNFIVESNKECRPAYAKLYFPATWVLQSAPYVVCFQFLSFLAILKFSGVSSCPFLLCFSTLLSGLGIALNTEV